MCSPKVAWASIATWGNNVPIKLKLSIIISFTMEITDVLSVADISTALKECQANNSFDCKKFFMTCGLSKKSAEDIRKVFRAIDDDDSGFIEEDELKYFLQRFSAGARVLNDKETKTFMDGGDKDGDGRLGTDEFVDLVLS
ncbi:parvalbumin, thymic CPV3-like isoform X1 [Hemiscyllium ocellatum]|uniref:parvalbumin, thymic CPV3-like isoform X1 n=1 Tax=Hemiscyllium ocellatum TaxID=170820 RepID=UPI002966A1E4|nr:parvalbumin, thymic CPV3-like isoform X1 [Hemiscyllium ocellatum]